MKSELARTTGRLNLAALALLASPYALANDSGWYIGAGVGESRATIDDERIASELLSGGLITSSIKDDDSDTGYKIFGGYQFGRHVALEAGYFDLGKFSFNAITEPPGTLAGSAKIRGANVDVVGILPIIGKLAALGRVGLIYAETTDSFAGTGAVAVLDPSPRKHDTSYKLGLGLQYAFTEAFAVRAEAERYRINDAVGNDGDIDLLSAGLVYRFGANSPPPTPPAVARVPVVVAPAPQPAPVAPPAPPAPPMPRKVSFSADSLFDFDKATVRPAGRQDLDKFAADLKGTTFDVITVTGYTDRLGSHAYNMGLSTRRAVAIKTYLVDSAGIPADKIAARGVDGSDPVTKPGECVGTKATRELIACLQPDRRVEVEVSGAR